VLGGGGGSTPTTPAGLSAPPLAAAPAVLPASASRRLALPGGLPPILVMLVILGSGLIAAGLRRLPDRVLQEPSTVCTLGGQS
jgi:hypothetical protein